jgi:hypothetical protein
MCRRQEFAERSHWQNINEPNLLINEPRRAILGFFRQKGNYESKVNSELKFSNNEKWFTIRGIRLSSK